MTNNQKKKPNSLKNKKHVQLNKEKEKEKEKKKKAKPSPGQEKKKRKKKREAASTAPKKTKKKKKKRRIGCTWTFLSIKQSHFLFLVFYLIWGENHLFSFLLT